MSYTPNPSWITELGLTTTEADKLWWLLAKINDKIHAENDVMLKKGDTTFYWDHRGMTLDNAAAFHDISAAMGDALVTSGPEYHCCKVHDKVTEIIG